MANFADLAKFKPNEVASKLDARSLNSFASNIGDLYTRLYLALFLEEKYVFPYSFFSFKCLLLRDNKLKLTILIHLQRCDFDISHILLTIDFFDGIQKRIQEGKENPSLSAKFSSIFLFGSNNNNNNWERQLHQLQPSKEQRDSISATAELVNMIRSNDKLVKKLFPKWSTFSDFNKSEVCFT